MQSLAIPTTGSVGYYMRLFMQTQFQLGSYIHAYTNEIYSLANIQNLIPTLAAIIRGCRLFPVCSILLISCRQYQIHCSMTLLHIYAVCLLCTASKQLVRTRNDVKLWPSRSSFSTYKELEQLHMQMLLLNCHAAG